MKNIGRLALTAIVVFVTSMAVATLYEWQRGTENAHTHIYSSAWFIAIMFIMAITSLTYAINKLRQQKAALLLHTALGIILLGSLITHTHGVQGTLHLRLDAEPQNTFYSDGKLLPMPMTLRLKHFEIIHYPGTDTPLDYQTIIVDNDGHEYTISMNHVASINNYRLFQSDYDDDQLGSYLSVNYDPIGMTISYIGYALMAIAFICLLMGRKGKFILLLKKMSSASVIAILLAISTLTSCTTEKHDAKTMTRADALKFTSRISIFSQNRIVPMDAYACDFALKLCGKNTYADCSPQQILIGWMCFPEEWQKEKMLIVKAALPETNGVNVNNGRVTVAELFDNDGTYKFENQAHTQNSKAVTELTDRVQLIAMLTTGAELRIFPFQTDGCTRWYSPTEQLPEGLHPDVERFVREFVNMTRIAIETNDTELLNLLSEKLAKLQQHNVGRDAMPTRTIRRLEAQIAELRPISWLSKIALALGIVMLIIASTKYGQTSVFFKRISLALLIIIGIAEALNIAARGIISGQFPISNGYETMLFLATMIALICVIARQIAMVVPLGMLLSGFALLVADIGLKNPPITPLMPVLHSPWLSLHVATVMTAYALLTLTAVNSLAALLTRKETHKRLEISLVLIYPAVALLAVGIFVGAVWANESWGSYWSWDPKEVWALISLLVYSAPLHQTLFPRFSHRAWHIYILAAFSCVLMTYFGVNYLLGGMHSYGA